ncbi:hypothetical protein DSO57_1007212 [Entomophthora muscae]|uniref:Uncharacterized protein n=1 Tax=Entomophthora muscae TaxID=34485 RepID=A0ACC2TI50_9FUNG|nr:hypothetical protein DSO57_1007212 [Entomophthora muscae]
MSSGIPMDKVVNSLHPQYFPRDEIEKLIDMFSLARMRIVNVTSQGPFDLYEPFYQTNYSLVDFDFQLPKNHTKIHLPPVIHAKPSTKGTHLPSTITRLNSTDHLRVWHWKGPASHVSGLSLALYDTTSDPSNNLNMMILMYLIYENWDRSISELNLRSEWMSLHLESNKLILNLHGTNLANTLAAILNITSTKSFVHQLETNTSNFIYQSTLACYQIDLLLMGEEDIQPILSTIQTFQNNITKCQPNPHNQLIPEPIFQSTYTPHGYQLDYFFPLPTQPPRLKALASLFYSFVEVDFYNTLRTKNHLAYALNANQNEANFGIHFLMEGVEDPLTAKRAMDNFLSTTKANLFNMPSHIYAQKKHNILRARKHHRPEFTQLLN